MSFVVKCLNGMMMCVCVNVLMYDNYTVSYNTVILYMIQERGEVNDSSSS